MPLTDVVVIEERIVTGSVNQNVLRVDNAKTPAIGAWCCTIRVANKGRIIQARHRREWRGCVGVWLIICSLGLDLCGKDVLSGTKLIFVQLMMLYAGANKPDWPCTFVKQATASVDGDLGQAGIFNIVIGDPKLQYVSRG